VLTALHEVLLPALPEAWIAARYLVAARDQAAGGDWFDVIPLPDGAIAVVVGDVVGTGDGRRGDAVPAGAGPGHREPAVCQLRASAAAGSSPWTMTGRRRPMPLP